MERKRKNKLTTLTLVVISGSAGPSPFDQRKLFTVNDDVGFYRENF